MGKSLCSHSNQWGITCELQPEGLWFRGVDVLKFALDSSLLVPFSAAYIFPSTILRSGILHYNTTSETDTFNEEVPPLLIEEMQKNGALGYLADGQGLNFVFFCALLYEIIENLKNGLL